MFGRFGREARRVIDLAEDHARALWRPAVGPEHLLLALLAVDDTGAFVRGGLCFDDVRAHLVETTACDPPARRQVHEARHLPLRLRSVFRDAFRHAAGMGAPEVTPLHLALALVDDPPGEIAVLLRRTGTDHGDLRAAVMAEILDPREADGSGDDNPVVRLTRVERAPAANVRHIRAVQ